MIVKSLPYVVEICCHVKEPVGIVIVFVDVPKFVEAVVPLSAEVPFASLGA